MNLLQISQYRILRQLGSGGASDVYLAEDTRLRRKVALKVMHPKLTTDPQQVARFRQEAEWMSMLTHPNLLTILDIGECDGVQYMATEFVEGETLRQRLTRATVPLKDAVDISIGIASALRVAHEMWIVHRDIKPENVLLHPDGYVKVLDFGVAKLLHSLNPKAITLPGMVLGTLQYLAPEQVNGEAVDPRTDLWSLGIVLYEMVAGATPFPTTSIGDLLRAITEGEIAPLSGRAVGAPPQIDTIVGRLLERDPEARYESAAALLVDLKDLREELSFLDRSRTRK